MILENYYHILWLDVSSTQKQIDKRWKEILKYLAIWDIPDYPEIDFSFTKSYRNETFVKDALNGLKNPKIRLQQIFFWINIETKEDKDVVTLLQKGEYEAALLEISKIKNLKNKAVFLSLLLSQDVIISILGKQQAILLCKESIDSWNIILTDDKKWISFEKSFYLYDDISTNIDLIQELRNSANKILADIFFDIWKLLDSSEITKYFTEIFHVKGTRIHWKSEEIYLELGRISENLENIKVSDDWVFDDSEKNQINAWIEKGKKLIADLSELGLEKDSKSVVMRDKLTNSIRIIALDLWNNLDDENKSGIFYIKEALHIVWTEGLKSKLEDDLNTMDGELKFSDSFKKIIKNIEWDEPEKALKEITKLENEITWGGKEWLMKLKKRAVFDLIGSKFIKAKKLFEDKNFLLSKTLFEEVEKLVNQYLEVFDWINPEGLTNVVNEIREDLEWIKNGNYSTDSVFNKIDTTRTSILEKLSEQDWYLAVFYIDSITYWFLAKVNQAPAGKIKPAFLYTLNGCGVSIYWDTTYITILWIPLIPLSRWNVVALWSNNYQFSWTKEMEGWKVIWKRIALGAIWIFLLFAFIDSNSSSNSSYTSSSNSYSSPQFDLSDFNANNSTTKTTTVTNSSDKKADSTLVNDSVTVWRYTCSSSNSIYLKSIEPVDPWLKQLSDEVDSLQSALDNTYVDQYSQSSVNSYNKKVKALNAKIESYKVKQTTYNNAVDKYNSYLEKNCTKRY